MKRRDFLKCGLAGSALTLMGPGRARPVAAQAEAVPMWEMSIAQLQEQMGAGALTAQALAQMYLERIERLDPLINSVIELNPQALDIARQLDQERRQGKMRGPLHGIPLLLKDNIDTADRMTTTAGSLALEGSIPGQDAFLVKKLRQAGAVFLAKANLSEWANFRSTRSSSGWSSRGGQTRNPYVLDRSPCGSSSGSGAAVAAGLCAGAIGTETDGSIVCPSTTCGIVGLKPTLGLISRSGVIPIAHSQDTAGPMARTVADVAILLGALTGEDPSDPATRGSVGKHLSEYTRFLDKGGLQGLRLGVARNFFGFHDRVDRLLEEAIAALRELGAEIVEGANVETTGQLDESEMEVLLYEFKADLNHYLAGLGPGPWPKTLEELIEFNENNRERVMPYFGQELFLRAQEKGPLSEAAYATALEKNHRLCRDEGIDAALQKNGLDALVAPTGGAAWAIDLVNGDHFGGGCSTPAAVAGYPHVTVPAGQVHGLPVGLSLFAGPWQEPMLLRIAHAFEQETRARQEPHFLKSVGL
jgi:amidase